MAKYVCSWQPQRRKPYQIDFRWKAIFSISRTRTICFRSRHRIRSHFSNCFQLNLFVNHDQPFSFIFVKTNFHSMRKQNASLIC